MSGATVVKWGVYHVWCPLARPAGNNKYVVAVCRFPNGYVGVFPVNSQIPAIFVSEGVEDAFVKLERGRYPQFITKQESFVDTTELWAVNVDSFDGLTPFASLRPDDREAVIRAKDYSPVLVNNHKRLVTLDGDLNI